MPQPPALCSQSTETDDEENGVKGAHTLSTIIVNLNKVKLPGVPVKIDNYSKIMTTLTWFTKIKFCVLLTLISQCHQLHSDSLQTKTYPALNVQLSKQ
jgi:hypothetical protein